MKKVSCELCDMPDVYCDCNHINLTLAQEVEEVEYVLPVVDFVWPENGDTLTLGLHSD